MQISNLTACSNNLYPIIKKEMPTLANVVFWIFYIHKDYKRVKDANLLKEPQRIQKKWIVRLKVVGDGLRLFDVLGRRFDSYVPSHACDKVRVLGLLAGALDGTNEQILAYHSFVKNPTSKNFFTLLSNLFFTGFSISSLVNMRSKLKNNSTPAVMISLMVLSIIGSIVSSNKSK